MRFLRRLFELYIFGNIHVALATWALSKLTLYQLEISPNYSALFVACSTLVSYNFIRLYRFQTTDSWFSHWIKENTIYLSILLILGVLGMLYTFLHIPFLAFLVLLPFSLLTLFYSLPLFNISLRSVPFAKIFAIAFSWAGATVLFPLASSGFSIWNSTILIRFIQQLIFIIILTLPFDIRDITYDKKSLQTLPQVIGFKNSKLLGFFLIIAFIFLNHYTKTNNLIILSSLLFFALLFASTKQHKYYAAFLVESIPIIWYLLSIN